MRSVVVSSSPDMAASLIAALQVQVPGHFVDFGCGTGHLLLNIARRFPEMECVGVEIDHQALDEARRSLSLCELANVFLVEGDIFNNMACAKDTAYVYLGGALNQRIGHTLFLQSTCKTLFASKYPAIGMIPSGAVKCQDGDLYIYQRHLLSSMVEWDYGETDVLMQDGSKYLLSRMIRLNTEGPLDIHVETVFASGVTIIDFSVGFNESRAGVPTILDLLISADRGCTGTSAVFRISVVSAGRLLTPTHTLKVHIGKTVGQRET